MWIKSSELQGKPMEGEMRPLFVRLVILSYPVIAGPIE